MKDMLMIAMTVAVFLVFNSLGQRNIFFANGLNVFFANGVFLLFPLGMLFFKLKDKLHSLASNATMNTTIHIFSIVSVIYLVVRQGDFFYEAAKTICAVFIFISMYISNIKNKMLLLLGDASYSIYLTHTFIVMAYGIISKAGLIPPSILLVIGIPIALTSIIFGVVAYFTIEKKLQEITGKLFFKKKGVNSNIVA